MCLHITSRVLLCGFVRVPAHLVHQRDPQRVEAGTNYHRVARWKEGRVLELQRERHEHAEGKDRDGYHEHHRCGQH